MPFKKPVASAVRQLIRAERQLFRADLPARLQARQLNRTILYEVAPRSDGSQGQCDDPDVAVAICNQTRTYFQRNVVRGELTSTGAYRVEVTEETELGDNASILEAKANPGRRRGASSCGGPAMAGVGSLKPTAARLHQSTKAPLISAEEQAGGPVKDLTPEEVERVENYLHGKDDSSPPPMALLRSYQARLERMSDLSAATASLINPPLAPRYHTGFVRPWDEYQAEIEIAKGNASPPMSAIPAFFTAFLTAYAIYYMFFPHVIRTWTRSTELGGLR